MKVAPENKILSQKQTSQKILRMAYEILENNFEESELIIAGIHDMGYLFAERLAACLKEITAIPVTLVGISLDKLAPLQSEIKLDCNVEELTQKVIILCDDVLNTGRTLAYSLKPFLNVNVKKLQTAVIVDRGHKDFPIDADYVGYSLSTTIQEHIEVILNDEELEGVYLL